MKALANNTEYAYLWDLLLNATSESKSVSLASKKKSMTARLENSSISKEQRVDRKATMGDKMAAECPSLGVVLMLSEGSLSIALQLPSLSEAAQEPLVSLWLERFKDAVERVHKETKIVQTK